MMKTRKFTLTVLVLILLLVMNFVLFFKQSYAGTGDLKVEFRSGNTNSITGTIIPCFKITNTGSTSIALSTVKLRYYYTRDTQEDQSYQFYYSTVGDANVTASFVYYSSPYPNADCHLEIGFLSEAGNLAPGTSAEVFLGIHKSSWSNYNQLDDNSYYPGSNYVEWNNVTAFIGGTVAWGTAPGSATPTLASTSTPSPTNSSVYYEAESAVLYNAGVYNEHAGYTGTGFVDYLNQAGGYIQWTANISQAGTYFIQFRYANNGTNSRPCQIIVNGKVVTSSLAFPITNALTNWAYVGINASLNSGNNTIKVLATDSNGGSNIDHMKITLIQATPAIYYEAEDATFSNASYSAKHPGYTGTGFVDFINQPGGYIQWTVNVAQTGVYKVECKYANNDTDNRPADIIANGQVVTSSLAFPITNDWATWSYVGTNALLSAGSNTIRILATGIDGGANIDHLKITFSHNPTPTPTPSPPQTPTPSQTHAPTPPLAPI